METRRVRKPPAARAARAKPDPAAETSRDRLVHPAIRVCSELQFLIRCTMIGHVLVDGGSVAVDAARLACGKLANGRGKARVDDEMRRTHQRRHETPGH